MLPATIPYEFIRDSQKFPVGRHELEALHIPGHTLGLVAFRLDDKYLFTGDSIFIRSIARPDLGGKAETWAPLLFEDEERWEERKRRDPILPGQPSGSVQRKKRSHQTVEGLPVHSFRDLLSALASRAKVTYGLKLGKSEEKKNLTFRQVPEPTPVQARAYELVRLFSVAGK